MLATEAIPCLVGCLVGWLVELLVYWSFGWQAAWLVCWSVGWLRLGSLGVGVGVPSAMLSLCGSFVCGRVLFLLLWAFRFGVLGMWAY